MKIERVEPLSWWTGMQHPLQLLFYGNNLQGAAVRCAEQGVSVTGIHQAGSPNYLFVDVQIAPDAKPGTYTFELTQGQQKIAQQFVIAARREGSANRKGFDTSDMIYLLMPDRFANGDPLNDTHEDAAEKADRKHPYGRHGGDLQGIINHLDYIQELGATAVWPTPLLFDNEPHASYHGYACTDYYRIDPRFGSNSLYKTMVDEAHRRGIKWIMDMVPNHCGAAHQWTQDLPFASWVNQFPAYTQSNYRMTTQSDPHASNYDKDLCTRGWFDRMMPDMNLANPFVLQYLSQMAVWWIEYANLDGLRVDTYPYSDKQGIAAWTKRIIDEYPHLNIVGEVWLSQPAFIAYWQANADNRDGYNSHLPAVMDFSLQENLISALMHDSLPAWDEGMMKVYTSLAQDFVYANPDNILIFAENHDTNRLAWLLKGKKEKHKMAMALLATMRGIPQLYYGSEWMLQNKAKQGHGEERLDMPGGWPGDKRNAFEASGRTKVENEIFEYTKKLFNWRKTATVIHTGKLMQFIPADNNFYIYFRYTDTERVMVVINNSKEEKTIDWPRYAEMTEGYLQGVDVISGRTVTVGESWRIPPQTAQVAHFRK
ncbi:MAG: glycoside hydrolase family 13 protein [Prevotellaceae bacterium]|jgi:glycosidase|nr:glycoside hydrolase family 13 protein [Prevotellaceae bacterium]